jgi:uncharacterized protein YyaL (SSP411 family)
MPWSTLPALTCCNTRTTLSTGIPGGDEAISKAVREHKPLIISIGYSACHWCHVMEHETYSDPEVARYMNEHFVSVKVDREEHPDVDQIYMHASQLLTGTGGWPLNAFALPDGSPFYVVTYLPRERWLLLLEEIVGLFRDQYDQVARQADQLTAGVRNPGALPDPSPAARGDRSPEPYLSLAGKMQGFLDPVSGGLGHAPKFPMTEVWEFFLQYHYLTGDKTALDAATRTLDRMAAGGIYDQLGGGFCRYATDREWRVPHFEKMLYDNAQLVSLYAHAYQLTARERYATVIRQTLAFVDRELSDPQGGFYASLNADSEGQEGKFYVWTEKEIDAALSKSAARHVKEAFHVTGEGNWESGLNILYRGVAAAEGHEGADDDRALGRAAETLFKIREKRVRPSLDYKILSSWNALMLRGYLAAWHALGLREYLDRALRAARFLDGKMIRADGVLYRNFAGGARAIPGVLEDYAGVAAAFLDLYEATLDVHWLSRANSLVRYAIAHFRDPETGLFFYSSDLTEHLVVRRLDTEDNVLPSSNAVMAHVLYRLGVYYSQDSYLSQALDMLGWMEASVAQAPPYYACWARLAGMTRLGTFEVAVVGEHAAAVAAGFESHYLPDCLLLGGATANLPLLEGKSLPGQTRIFVCRDRVCSLPVTTVAEALDQIVQARRGRPSGR